MAALFPADPERLGLTSDLLVPRLEEMVGAAGAWGDAALETLAALAPGHPRVAAALAEFDRLVKKDYVAPSFDENQHAPRRVWPHPQTYFAVAYAAVPASRVVAQIRRDLAWLSDTSNSFFERDFVRDVTRRLSRDPSAADAVQSHIVDVTTPDAEAAAFASLLAAAVQLDQSLILRAPLPSDGADYSRPCTHRPGPSVLLLAVCQDGSLPGHRLEHGLISPLTYSQDEYSTYLRDDRDLDEAEEKALREFLAARAWASTKDPRSGACNMWPQLGSCALICRSGVLGGTVSAHRRPCKLVESASSLEPASPSSFALGRVPLVGESLATWTPQVSWVAVAVSVAPRCAV